MPLQNFVDSSSSQPIINGAIKVKNDYLPLHLLVANGNPLGVNSINAIKQHFNAGAFPRLTNDQVNTYLSSSALLHLLDGWTYLSHSIDSLLKGDSGVAIHLSYYAELRATMSFLAVEGIGIFDKQHFCLTSSNRIVKNPPVTNAQGRPVNSGTHQFTWDVIEKWTRSTVKPSSNDILKVFSVNNKTFDEWANAFPYSSQSNAILIVKNWLKKWNLDVSNFRKDRDMRNNVSYRPQRLVNVPLRYTLNAVIENLGSIWNLLEPNQSNRFQALDKYLLRMFLQEMYNSLSARVKLTNTLESLIAQTLGSLGLNIDQSFIDFLKDTTPINHCIFIEAGNSAIDPATGELNAIAVISRSILMLRISTGNISLMYKKAGISMSELDFLWEKFGVENGLWETGTVPSDFEELWDDIKDHIDDTLALADLYSPDLSLSKIYAEKEMPLPFNYFKQFQRAALWGLSL